MPSSCAWARESSSGSPEMKAWSPSAAASGSVRPAPPEQMPMRLICAGPPRNSWTGLPVSSPRAKASSSAVVGSGSVPWTASGAPRLSANQPSTCSPSSAAMRALLPSRRVGVEREVVGGEPDVVVEEHLQPPLEQRIDEQRPGAPEQPVVHDEQLRPDGGGVRERLERRRDGGRDQQDLAGTGHLEPVRPVVPEPPDVELGIEERDDLARGRAHRPSLETTARHPTSSAPFTTQRDEIERHRHAPTGRGPQGQRDGPGDEPGQHHPAERRRPVDPGERTRRPTTRRRTAQQR